MSAPPGDDPLVLDPRLDELPFPVLVRRRAAAMGATTLRQLARIRPEALVATDTVALATTRAIVERYVGRPWEELASVEPSPPFVVTAPVPICWDDLRLALPTALRAMRLDDLQLPVRMLDHAAREGLQTLDELAQRSEARLLDEPKLGRLTIHRTFLALLAIVEGGGGGLVAPPPAVAVPPGAVADPRARRALAPPRPAKVVRRELAASGIGLLHEWKARLTALPPEPHRAMRLRAGLDGRRPETFGAVGALMGVSRARAQRFEVEAVDLLTRDVEWMDEVRVQFTAALLRVRKVRLAELASDAWWAGIVAQPEALDYFGERVLDGDACVLELDGVPFLAKCVKPAGG